MSLHFLTFSLVAIEVASSLDGQRHGASQGALERAVPLATAEEQVSCDGMLDSLMLAVGRDLAHSGRAALPLPDVDLLQTGVQVRLQRGRLRGLESMARRGHATLRWGGGNVTLAAALGFDNLTVSYDAKASMAFLSKEASVAAKINTNHVSVKIGVYFVDDRCWIALKELALTYLGDVELSIEGFGILNSPVSSITQTLLSPSSLKTAVNAALQSKVKFNSTCIALIPGLGMMKNRGF